MKAINEGSAETSLKIQAANLGLSPYRFCCLPGATHIWTLGQQPQAKG